MPAVVVFMKYLYVGWHSRFLVDSAEFFDECSSRIAPRRRIDIAYNYPKAWNAPPADFTPPRSIARVDFPEPSWVERAAALLAETAVSDRAGRYAPRVRDARGIGTELHLAPDRPGARRPLRHLR
jgi:hypothetical protein